METPRTGAQSRKLPLAKRARPAVKTRVAAALAGAPVEAAPSAASATRLNAMGMMVTEISMITVPATNGVITLRSNERWDARAN